MSGHSIKYGLKVWLTAVFVAPALIIMFGFINSGHLTADAATIYIAGVVIGMVLSIPSFLILWLVTTILCKNEKPKPDPFFDRA